MSLVMPLWLGGAQWIQMAKIHQKFVHSMWFHNFFKHISAIIQHFRFRRFQICQSVSVIKLISMLIEFPHCICLFIYLIFGGIFDNWSNCAACVAALWHAWKSTRFVFAGSLASKLTRTSSMSLAIKPCSWAWFLNFALKFAPFCGTKENLSNCNVIIR